METTGADAYCLNCKNERHNRSIHHMVIADLLDSNKHEHKLYQSSIDAEYTVR